MDNIKKFISETFSFITENLKISKIEDELMTIIDTVTLGQASDSTKQTIRDFINIFKLLIIYIGVLGILISLTICALNDTPIINYLTENIVILYVIEYFLLHFYKKIIINLIGDTDDNILPNFMKIDFIENHLPNLLKPFKDSIILYILFKFIDILQPNNILKLIVSIPSNFIGNLAGNIPVAGEFLKIPFYLLSNYPIILFAMLIDLASAIDINSILSNYFGEKVKQKVIDVVKIPKVVTDLL